SSSSSGPRPMAGRRGGRGGGLLPEGCVWGRGSSFSMRPAIVNAQHQRWLAALHCKKCRRDTIEGNHRLAVFLQPQGTVRFESNVDALKTLTISVPHEAHLCLGIGDLHHLAAFFRPSEENAGKHEFDVLQRPQTDPLSPFICRTV